MLWMVCPPPAPAHCSASPHPTPVFFFQTQNRIYKFQKRNLHPQSLKSNLEFISSVNVLYWKQEWRAGLEL